MFKAPDLEVLTERQLLSAFQVRRRANLCYNSPRLPLHVWPQNLKNCTERRVTFTTAFHNGPLITLPLSTHLNTMAHGPLIPGNIPPTCSMSPYAQFLPLSGYTAAESFCFNLFSLPSTPPPAPRCISGTNLCNVLTDLGSVERSVASVAWYLYHPLSCDVRLLPSQCVYGRWTYGESR